MTKVRVSGYNERFYLEASGHALSPIAGSIEMQNDADKVCAAISILMLSAAHRLREMEAAGDFYSCTVAVESGYAVFDIEPREDARERVEEIIEILCAGISLLEENYPAFITLS